MRHSKARTKNPVGESEGESIQLTTNSRRDNAIRICTVSWGIAKNGYQSRTVNEFLSTLKRVARDSESCDLVITAGWSISEYVSPKSALEATGGCPLLYETAGGAWLLTHVQNAQPATTLLRREQLVENSKEFHQFSKFVTVISSGAGVIEFTGISFKLVLFICGENNVLQRTTQKSVLHSKAIRDMPPPETFCGDWVMINPAHRPYWPQIRSTGFAKVGVVGSARPTLKKLVMSRAEFLDGTRSPIAVVHTNNFLREEPKTHEYSCVVFGDDSVRARKSDSGVVEDHKGRISWKFSTIEIYS